MECEFCEFFFRLYLSCLCVTVIKGNLLVLEDTSYFQFILTKLLTEPRARFKKSLRCL